MQCRVPNPDYQVIEIIEDKIPYFWEARNHTIFVDGQYHNQCYVPGKIHFSQLAWVRSSLVLEPSVHSSFPWYFIWLFFMFEVKHSKIRVKIPYMNRGLIVCLCQGSDVMYVSRLLLALVAHLQFWNLLCVHS